MNIQILYIRISLVCWEYRARVHIPMVNTISDDSRNMMLVTFLYYVTSLYIFHTTTHSSIPNM